MRSVPGPRVPDLSQTERRPSAELGGGHRSAQSSQRCSFIARPSEPTFDAVVSARILLIQVSTLAERKFMSSNETDNSILMVADEVSSVVDDAEVISKTLPSTHREDRFQGQSSHALDVTRDQVAEHPIQSLLIAAAAGSALSALVISWLLDASFSSGRSARLRGGCFEN